MQYNFDWDPDKERKNIRKHKLDFRRAATVFRDPRQLSIYDEEHSEIRIISARKAEPPEILQYQREQL